MVILGEVARRHDVRVGDEVELPWGFDTVRGVVIDIYGPSARPHVLVRVPIQGPEESADTISVPKDAVVPLTPA